MRMSSNEIESQLTACSSVGRRRKRRETERKKENKLDKMTHRLIIISYHVDVYERCELGFGPFHRFSPLFFPLSPNIVSVLIYPILSTIVRYRQQFSHTVFTFTHMRTHGIFFLFDRSANTYTAEIHLKNSGARAPQCYACFILDSVALNVFNGKVSKSVCVLDCTYPCTMNHMCEPFITTNTVSYDLHLFFYKISYRRWIQRLTYDAVSQIPPEFM